MKRRNFFDGTTFKVAYDPNDRSRFNVNLLAVDFGDGDIDVAGKLPEGNIGLFRLDDNQSERRANVIAASSTLERHMVEWIESPEARSGEGDVFYCNFKCSPRSGKFNSAYTIQVEVETVDEEGQRVTELRNRPCSYQNGELMGLAFAKQVDTILSRNSEVSYWKMDKPTVLYVGCPAGTRDPSSEWYGTEEEYGEFLLRALEQYADDNPESCLRQYRDHALIKTCDPLVNCRLPIDLRVAPESNAAVAYEMNKRYGQQLNKGRIIILIDLGSSTTDFAYVNDGKLVDSLSYSRNLGGGMFEEIMLKLIQEKVHPDFMSSTSNERIWLRFEKEEFYKKNKTSTYTMTYKNGDEHEFYINKAFMEEVVNDVPVTVPGSLASGLDDLQCDSLKDAYRRVFKEYKKRIGEDKNSKRTQMPAGDVFSLFAKDLGNTPDMIVVTGGVSKVGWVMGLIKDIFGVEPKKSQMPHASVAFGLGFVAETELKKEILIREIMWEIKKMLGSGDGKIFTELRDRIADICLNKDFEVINSTMEEWAANPEPQSIAEWYAAYRNRNNYYQDKERAVGEDLDAWWKESGLLPKLDQLLKDKFIEIFEDANGDFDFKIRGTDLLTKLHNVISVRWIYFNPQEYFKTVFSGKFKDIDLKRESTVGRKSKRACYRQYKKNEDRIKRNWRLNYRRMLSEGYVGDNKPKELIDDMPAMQHIYDTIYSSLEDEVYRYAEYLTNFFYSE